MNNTHKKPVIDTPFYRTLTLPGGLSLYAADEIDTVSGFRTKDMEAGLRLPLVLGTASETRFGGQGIPLGTDERGQHRAALVNLREPAAFGRHMQAGQQRRVISLHMPQDWLDAIRLQDPDADRRLRRFLAEPVCVRAWQVPPAYAARLDRFCTGLAEDNRPASLMQACQCMTLLSDALDCLFAAGAPSHGTAQSGRQQRCMARVCEWLKSGEADQCSLEQLARDCGMSISTLQRHFRQYTGQTIGDYLREHRLQTARQLLQQDRVSVLEAALAAGYGSAANFATAFRKRFGITPAAARQAGSRPSTSTQGRPCEQDSTLALTP